MKYPDIPLSTTDNAFVKQGSGGYVTTLDMVTETSSTTAVATSNGLGHIGFLERDVDEPASISLECRSDSKHQKVGKQ